MGRDLEGGSMKSRHSAPAGFAALLLKFKSSAFGIKKSLVNFKSQASAVSIILAATFIVMQSLILAFNTTNITYDNGSFITGNFLASLGNESNETYANSSSATGILEENATNTEIIISNSSQSNSSDVVNISQGNLQNYSAPGISPPGAEQANSTANESQNTAENITAENTALLENTNITENITSENSTAAITQTEANNTAVPETPAKLNIKNHKKDYAMGDKIHLSLEGAQKVSKPKKGLGAMALSETRTKAYLIAPGESISELAISDNGVNQAVEIDTGRSFKPGVYKVLVENVAADGTVIDQTETEFALGLVNINTLKSIYLPNENATVIVGVLDSHGSRVNNGYVNVTITSPSGAVQTFYYEPIFGNGNIKNNKDGTYTVNYLTSDVGTYTIYASAYEDTRNISANYTTTFEVRSYVVFDITRIAPTVTYLEGEKVKILVTPMEDAQDVSVIEYVPSDWNITTNGVVADNGANKSITWFIAMCRRTRLSR